jgi:hypothetical protein
MPPPTSEIPHSIHVEVPYQNISAPAALPVYAHVTQIAVATHVATGMIA